MARKVDVRTPDEFVAAVPHVLGFKPNESIVVIPLGAHLPISRIDIPTKAAERRQMVNALGAAYARNAERSQGARLAILCMTENGNAAEAATRALAKTLKKLGMETPVRVWANSGWWTDLTTGGSGPRTASAENRMAAEAAVLGKPQPVESREALVAGFIGDRAPVAAVLGEARSRARQEAPDAQHNWAVNRLAQFHRDGRALNDQDAARLLVALESKPTRDVLWADMAQENAVSHSNLWSDLTCRAPDEVRAPAATLLAFSCWLQGDGVKAAIALDQIPAAAKNYSMANLTAALVENAVDPGLWNDTKAMLMDSEAFVPGRPGQQHERSRPIDPPAPGTPAPGI